MAPDEKQDAYEKGVDDAETDAHFAEHDRHLLDINGSIDKMVEELRGVKGGLRELQQRERSRDDVAKATKAAVDKHGRENAAAVKKQSDKQVTNRTFYVGVGGLALALYLAVNPPG